MVDPFLSPSGPSDPGCGGGHKWAWPWRKIASAALSRQAVPSSVIIQPGFTLFGMVFVSILNTY
jgi:hypothetical protein